MAHKRAEVPEPPKMLQYGRKKFVRYNEGAKLYSMGLHTFQNLAKEADKPLGVISRSFERVTFIVFTAIHLI